MFTCDFLTFLEGHLNFLAYSIKCFLNASATSTDLQRILFPDFIADAECLEWFSDLGRASLGISTYVNYHFYFLQSSYKSSQILASIPYDL